MNNSITDIKGILVGQTENSKALTGCSVVICEKGAVGGISQRGGAPGTRETDLLRPMHLVQKVHGILLAGGSAYGLNAAAGVMQYLEEKKIGFNTGTNVVPIVPSAILYDLDVGDANIRPDKEMGYKACLNASTKPPNQGNYGAGTGATVGKILGIGQAMKSGIGTASLKLSNGVVIGALVAVNAFGDIIKDNEIIAGVRTLKKGPIKIGQDGIFANTLSVMQSFAGRKILSFASKQNTVIGVVATNAILSKEETNYFAASASNGIAVSIRPAFTMFDGDTIFGISTGQIKSDINILSAVAPQVISEAIVSAITSAGEVDGLPSYQSIIKTI
jgi:L-aminopeptidase/D-esterase-like protein